MHRVPEPELMDTPQVARKYDEMDHSEVNHRFVEDFLALASIQGEILDLGTGTARIPIQLCQLHSDVRVLAVDLSPSMLDIASINVELAGLKDRILLDLQDAKRLQYTDGRFSAVISNSLVHHILNPIGVLREAVRVTGDNKMLFFRDLARPCDNASVTRIVTKHAGGESEHAQQMFANSLRAALTIDEIGEMVEEIGFDRSGVHSSSDRHWTWISQKTIVPQN